MKKCLQVGTTLLLALMWVGCPNPLRRSFENPVDPDSDTYIGTPSEDNDGDGIGQYEDVDEIVLLSPKDGEAITTLPLSLITNKFNPAKVKKYWIQIATSNSDFDGSVIFSKGDYAANECGVPAGVMTEIITYYWRAKASDGSKWSDNWSAKRSFLIDVDTSVPWYPSPSSGSTISDTTLLLDWEDVAGASGYQVQVNTNDSYTGTMVVDNSALMTSQYQVATTLSDNTTYYWHVKVKNTDGVWGDWSSTWSFAIDIAPPASPSPSSGGATPDTTPLLDWEDVAGASGYQVQVNTNDSFTGTMVVDNSALTTSQYQVATTLSDNTTYYWHVKVKNTDGVWGDWSSTWSFAIDIEVGNAEKVYSGGLHSFALKSDGTLWACGENGNGQLGTGDTTARLTFTQVLSGVSAVTAGMVHSLALKGDGTLCACGFNGGGKLGTGDADDTYRSTFTPVLSGVSAVAAGSGNSNHSFALKSDGTLWACGPNRYGQLGTGDTTCRFTFIQVLTGVSAVSAGFLHSMALKIDGTLWTCGNNDSGQLGTGDTTGRLTFTQVLSGVSTVAAGASHSLALKGDGTLWACGANGGGQLGTGDTMARLTFTQVLSGVSAVTAGGHESVIGGHTLALKNDGTVWACGSNNSGQLGTGDTTGRLTFIQILTGAGTVSAGGFPGIISGHSLAKKNDGTLWACGENGRGDLGTGDTIDRLTFTQVFAY